MRHQEHKAASWGSDVPLRRVPATGVLQARWVFPVQGEPLPEGQVQLERGRVVAVGRGLTTRPLELGSVALLPGLVNAHCHLEFSLLQRPLGRPGMAFPRWIEQVVQWRRSREEPPAEVPSPWQAGLRESAAAGVAAVGEVLSAAAQRIPPAPWPQLVVFFELLGLTPERAEQAIARAEQFLQQAPAAGWLGWGLSPHAPYTVHPRLLAWAVGQSRRRHLPLQFHLAESPEELELLRTGDGPLAELLQELGAWCPEALPGRLRPLDFLQSLQKAHRVLVIHGNYLSAAEQQFLARGRKRFSLVYCPRTHAYFQHQPYPLAELLQQGVRVVLGTDSRASSPGLELLHEARCAAAQHQVAPAQLLRMITLDAARALGLDATWGRIAPGSQGVFTAVQLPPNQAPQKANEVLEAIFHGPAPGAELIACGPLPRQE